MQMKALRSANFAKLSSSNSTSDCVLGESSMWHAGRGRVVLEATIRSWYVPSDLGPVCRPGRLLLQYGEGRRRWPRLCAIGRILAPKGGLKQPRGCLRTDTTARYQRPAWLRFWASRRPSACGFGADLSADGGGLFRGPLGAASGVTAAALWRPAWPRRVCIGFAAVIRVGSVGIGLGRAAASGFLARDPRFLARARTSACFSPSRPPQRSTPSRYSSGRYIPTIGSDAAGPARQRSDRLRHRRLQSQGKERDRGLAAAGMKPRHWRPSSPHPSSMGGA